MRRIYPKTTGYWVYAHTTPNGMIYIGMSKQQPCRRWQKSLYKTHNSLAQYIEQYGWENIEHRVVIDGLTKKQAEQWEDRLIQALSMNGLCINKQRSGGIYRDDKQAYDKQWREDHKEERTAYNQAYNKQYYEGHKEEHKAYDKQYRKDHKAERKAYVKRLLSTAEGKIYNRVTAYNHYHPDKVIETPKEARQKYIETGYVPSYIKNDDIT